MSFAQQFFIAQIAFLAGVALADRALPPWWFFAVLASGSVLVVGAVRGTPVVVLLPLALALGAFLLHRTDVQWQVDPLLAEAGKTAIVRGTVSREPDVRLDRQRLMLDVTAIGGEETVSLRSRMLLTLPLYPEYAYGDRLTVRCRLQEPRRIERFAYDEYLALEGVHVLCNRGAVLERTPAAGNLLVRPALGIKRWFVAQLAAVLPEPQASFAAAILVGARRGMPEGVLQDFQKVGLTHLLALSGYNITILVAALGATGRSLGASRRQIFWTTTALLALFVVMTGASASVVRAALMGALVLVASQLGRAHTARYLLCFAATLMVAAHPRILLHDVGFQLSFLATAGLLVSGAWWHALLARVPAWLQLRTSLATTLAASVPTLPLLLLTFGRVSFISPLANVLVLPAMPLAMLTAFLSVLPVVGNAVVWTAWGVLTWILGAAQALASLPAPHKSAVLSGVLLVLLCGTLVVMLVRRFHRFRHAPLLH